MALIRGEEGSVKFDDAGSSSAAIVGTRSWSLTVTKDTYECTGHGDQQKKYVGGLVSGDGSVELYYQATSGDETAAFLNDVFTAEDDGTAAFELFTDTSGSKKISFDGIITSAEFGATVGEIQTVTCNFVTNGAITNAA